MLVLSRKPGETIYIGENREIAITVTQIRSGNKVMLGIQAPKDIPIIRAELDSAVEAVSGSKESSNETCQPA